MPNFAFDLLRIHRVITRGLTVLEEKCRAFAENGFPDDTTREGFWKYCQALEGIIQAHHSAEDNIFFPFVEPRLSERDIARLRVEHHALAAILNQMKAMREAGSVADLRPELSKLAGVWYPHIHKEETWFSPEIMGQVMTAPEHIDMAQKVAAHSAAHAQPAPLCVPFMLYNAEAEDRAVYLKNMPPELTQQLVPIVWKDEWAPMKLFLLD
jgi:hemerythrin-like domain-containing protein